MNKQGAAKNGKVAGEIEQGESLFDGTLGEFLKDVLEDTPSAPVEVAPVEPLEHSLVQDLEDLLVNYYIAEIANSTNDETVGIAGVHRELAGLGFNAAEIEKFSATARAYAEEIFKGWAE